VPRSHPADHLFVGTVVTLNPEQPLAAAAAVRDGRIIAVGKRADFVVLSANPPECAGEGLRKLQV